VPVITNWTPVIGYMLMQNDATTASYYYYKIILEVRLEDASGTLLAKIKQRRNGYADDITNNKARAFFDLRDIANTQLINTVFDQNDTGDQPYRSIHTLGANTAARLFSFNGDNKTGKTQLEKIYVKGYQEYSTTQTGVPTEVTSDTVNDTLYYLQASLPLMTARSTDDAYIQGTDFNVFNMSGTSDRFLSDVESQTNGQYGITGYINYVQWDDSTDVGDYHTLAFLNDYTNFASDAESIVVRYRNSDGDILTTTEIQNETGNGGIAPDSGSLADTGRLLYVGVGPGNLEAQSTDSAAQPSDGSNNDWAYYEVYATTTGMGALRSAVYYFVKEDGSCKGYKVRRLAWRNSVGGYDYFNFKRKSIQTTNVERNTYSSMLGTYDQARFSYDNTQRGKATRETTANLKETINTDWLSEEQANLIEKLIMSTDVYIVENADTTYTQPVMITDSSFLRKTVVNDKMIQYTINIEYANSINTNS
jgi:hypothetical protein